MKKQDVIREVMSMFRDGMGFQVAKDIVNLAAAPAGTVKKIGPRSAGRRHPMTQESARKLVDAAKERIALVDGDDAPSHQRGTEDGR